MTTPALEAERFALACLLGLLPGAVYGFLRPLRPKYTVLADSVFLAVTALVWLYLSFGICRGDLRLAYSAGLLAGGMVWEWTAGRLLRPVFTVFWRLIGNILGIIALPGKKILYFSKILIASVEKWVTIKWRNRRHYRCQSGGLSNGAIKRIFQSNQADPQAQQQSEQDRVDHHHLVVYGSAVHAASGYEQN